MDSPTTRGIITVLLGAIIAVCAKLVGTTWEWALLLGLVSALVGAIALHLGVLRRERAEAQERKAEAEAERAQERAKAEAERARGRAEAEEARRVTCYRCGRRVAPENAECLSYPGVAGGTYMCDVCACGADDVEE